jgi:copper(I)-binding protein
VAGACAALALTGCSAGQLTQTGSQVPAVPGTNITVGSIALRDLTIQYNGPDGYRMGDDAPLGVRIFNDGAEPVTLTGVTADKAEAVTLVDSPGATASAAPPSGSPSPVPPPSPGASPSPEASPATSPSPGASPSPAAPPSPSPSPAPPASSRLSIQIPPQGYVLMVPEQGSYLQLTRLKEPVMPGDSVRVTFTFDNGASVPIEIPLVPPSGMTVPRATPVVPGGEEGH